eukprot:11987022-Prorocentrum_lima.AAC.1
MDFDMPCLGWDQAAGIVQEARNTLMEAARVLLGCPAAFPPLWQQRVEWQLQATGSMGGFCL